MRCSGDCASSRTTRGSKRISDVGTRKRSDSEPLGQALTHVILESIADGVFTTDLQWRVTSFNRAAEEITGIPRRSSW